ncbi:exonuclease SbcCD subunit D [Blautia luti]|uniref:exonuclease SbcCD subunit D n=1 Tax=Blautia luti TaxID=89014 RepID=UPI001D0195C4|nr:exonuclease SbcCD subunit D [Blautia luti]MCB5474480.1 exonuclease SbcCD subunit D [Blautia luti]
MKLIHLSDLHLGKRVNEFSMIEDQKYILNQILGIIDEEQPDGILLAGDLYDRPVPSAEAVQLLDSFLTRLAKRKIPVYAISGNHDSAERIAFGSHIMSSSGICMSPVYDGKTAKYCLMDNYGEVWIHLLPFIRPAVVRHVFAGEEGAEEIRTYQEAVQAAVEHMDLDTEKRNVLVAHQFVVGAMSCDSEEITVGGIDQIEGAVFRDFDYVALGHIHSPQNVGNDRIRYCGTPLKYSFSEAGQQKSVTVVELGEKGTLEVREIQLKPLRDMRKLKGTYMAITSLSNYQDTNTEDYVQITLTDEEDIVDGMQKLRTIYPNLMRLEYDNFRTRKNQKVTGTETVEKKSELEYFEEFFELQNNQPMNEEQRKFSEELIRKLGEVRF